MGTYTRPVLIALCYGDITLVLVAGTYALKSTGVIYHGLYQGTGLLYEDLNQGRGLMF